MIIEEYRKLNIHDPKIHIKRNNDTPDRIYNTIIDSIRTEQNSFLFISGRIATKSLERIGIHKEDARRITSLINSAIKIDHTLASNGDMLDINIHPLVAKGDEGIAIINNFISIYFQIGGYETHINVVSADALRRAMSEPEKYKNLQVRLCSWNVYFTELNRESQIDFINNLQGISE